MKIQIINYKGNVVANWSIPKTEKQLAWTVIKLVRFYYRCKDSGLLTNEVIHVIQECIGALKDSYFINVHPEVIKGIKEIQALKPHNLEEEIITEKIRKHEQAVCSLCGTDLKYPAYIVYRKGLEVIKVSAPIGIFCLKSVMGKLRDLIVQMKVKISDHKICSSSSTKMLTLSLPFIS